ncbi:MAG: DUF2490 domain-containing protein [Bacteroidetes bacterium]|nr:MAG: DUF2490 domain-containing protein [Bacteroidota bacterium]
MKNKIKIIVIGILLLQSNLFAQKTETRSETWFQVYSNFRLSDKWGIVSDFGYRRKDDFLNTYFQGLARAGVAYYWQKHSFIVGFALFETENQIEYRPYQRLIISQSIGKLQIQHRYRFEQRFRNNATTEKLDFNYRFGYQINLQYPLIGKEIKPKIPFLIAQDEIFINFGKNIMYNYFDQNRILLGIGYQFTKEFSMNTGYQYQFLQQPNGIDSRHSHTIRLNAVFNFDFRKPKEEKPVETK